MFNKIISVLGVLLIYLVYYGVNSYIYRDIDINNKGIDLFDAKNYTGSLVYFNDALDLKPKSSLYNFNKAYALFNLGDYNRSLVFYDNAISYYEGDNYDLSDIYSHRGASYFELYQYNKSIEDIKKSLELDSSNKWGLFYDSTIKNYSDYYNYTGSLDSINKYILINNTNPDAFYQKGEIYYYSAQYELATKAYTKAIELNSEDAGIHYQIGNSNYLLGFYDIAMNSYTKAYELNDQNYLYAFYLGYSLYSLGRIEESKKYFEESLSLEGGVSDEAVKLFNLYVLDKYGTKEEVELFLKKYYGLGVNKLSFLLGLIKVFNEEGYSRLKSEIDIIAKEY